MDSGGGPVLPRRSIVPAALFVSILAVASPAPVCGSERLPSGAGGSGLIVAGAVVLSLLAGVVGLLFANAGLRRAMGQLSGKLRELEGIMAAIPDILFTIDPGEMPR